MKHIRCLSQKHKNQAIWIAGSGPSLDTYPSDFFNDKVGITLHMAFLKFPNTSYMYANESDRVDYLKKNHNNYRNVSHIYAYPFFGISRRESRDLVEDIPNVNYFYLRPYPPYGIRGEVDWEFTKKKVRQAIKGKALIFGGHGTCLHGALFCALLLGGNPINLIGTGHGMYQGAGEHFQGIVGIDKKMRPTAPSFANPNNNVPMIEQTQLIIEACRLEDIQVNWIKEYSASGMYEKYKLSTSDITVMKSSYKKEYSARTKRKNRIKRIVNPLINRM